HSDQSSVSKPRLICAYELELQSRVYPEVSLLQKERRPLSFPARGSNQSHAREHSNGKSRTTMNASGSHRTDQEGFSVG
ncbi:unnamed protein product, partial [Mycena citricolor]